MQFLVTMMMWQVYVAEPGYMLSRASVPKQAILTHLAGAALPDLATLAQARQLKVTFSHERFSGSTRNECRRGGLSHRLVMHQPCQEGDLLHAGAGCDAWP